MRIYSLCNGNIFVEKVVPNSLLLGCLSQWWLPCSLYFTQPLFYSFLYCFRRKALFIRWWQQLYICKKVKGYKKQKKVRKSTNKLPLSFMVHIFNSVPYFDPCLHTHLKCYQGSALLFVQLIILLCFKENWKLTSELNSKNIKHLLCNVITNYLLSILYLAPPNLSF